MSTAGAELPSDYICRTVYGDPPPSQVILGFLLLPFKRSGDCVYYTIVVFGGEGVTESYKLIE